MIEKYLKKVFCLICLFVSFQDALSYKPQLLPGIAGEYPDVFDPILKSTDSSPGSPGVSRDRSIDDSPAGEQALTKKKDPTAGFLGVEDVLNPVIKLKRLLEGEDENPEPPCVRTYFMGPFKKPVTITANGSVGQRKDQTCQYNFIGTEACIPLLECSHFSLSPKKGGCEEKLQVFDGYKGFQTFTGTDSVSKIQASDDLRDLFITFNACRKSPVDQKKFKCKISCSNRGDGQPLERAFKPKMNTYCRCGERVNQERIVGGYDSNKWEFPWIAALVKAKTRQPFCGGSIINDRMILTAAHCFKGKFLQIDNIEILLGAHQLDVTTNYNVALDENGKKPALRTYDSETLASLDKGNGSVRFTIEEAIIHPLYVKETNDFDVALIKLSTPIDFMAHKQLRTICLPKLGTYLRTYAKREAIVAGWGLGGAESPGTNSILQKLNVTVYTPKYCKNIYAFRVSRRMLCAGYPQGGKDSCMGDSGGPLVLQDKPQVWFQIGSVSWGDGCAESASPGAYIRMTEVGQWIHHHSNQAKASWCSVAIA